MGGGWGIKGDLLGLRLECDVGLVRDGLSTVHHLRRSSQRPQILQERRKRVINELWRIESNIHSGPKLTYYGLLRNQRLLRLKPTYCGLKPNRLGTFHRFRRLP